MKFIQKTFHHLQHNTAPPEKVFPLLCPVREYDWLDGWQAKIIHSESGLVEENCVFTTPHHGEMETVWHVTKHDPENFEVAFVRVTPGENVVRIQIKLVPEGDAATQSRISYQYTALNEAQNEHIRENLPAEFAESMNWWERALNHYLDTGEMLKKD